MSVSRFCDNKLHCIRHPSGLRLLVKLLSKDPFCLSADQKIFGAMPCPNDIVQTLWLLTIPFVAHGMGSKEVDNFMYVWNGLPIRFFVCRCSSILYALFGNTKHNCPYPQIAQQVLFQALW